MALLLSPVSPPAPPQRRTSAVEVRIRAQGSPAVNASIQLTHLNTSMPDFVLAVRFREKITRRARRASGLSLVRAGAVHRMVELKTLPPVSCANPKWAPGNYPSPVQ
jgi:hypothetical protein